MFERILGSQGLVSSPDTGPFKISVDHIQVEEARVHLVQVAAAKFGLIRALGG